MPESVVVVSEGLKEKRGSAAGDFLALSIPLFGAEPGLKPAAEPVRRPVALENEDGREEDVGEGLAGKTKSGRGVVDSPYDEERVVDIV